MTRIRLSDRLCAVSALSKRAHASILLEMAARTVKAARLDWIAAKDATDEVTLRRAYRAAVLARRSLRSAAEAWATDERTHRLLTAEAAHVDAAAAELLSRLARAS